MPCIRLAAPQPHRPATPAGIPRCAPLLTASVDAFQYKEYATHLDHHLKDACSRSADFVARQAAYGEALGAFATQAASMSKFEEGAAAQAFLELNTAASAVAGEHSSATTHMNRCATAPTPLRCITHAPLQSGATFRVSSRVRQRLGLQRYGVIACIRVKLAGIVVECVCMCGSVSGVVERQDTCNESNDVTAQHNITCRNLTTLVHQEGHYVLTVLMHQVRQGIMLGFVFWSTDEMTGPACQQHPARHCGHYGHDVITCEGVYTEKLPLSPAVADSTKVLEVAL